MGCRPEDVIEEVCKVREQITICNNTIGEATAGFVLKEKDTILQKVREGIEQNFQTLKGWMNTQDALEWVEPKGGVVPSLD